MVDKRGFVGIKSIQPELYDKLKKLINSMGYELYGVSMKGVPATFSIYIEKENGVTIDDCSKVSQQVGAMLDVEAENLQRYRLEVSSPGIERQLFTLEQYQRYVGNQIKLKLRLPLAGKKQYKGMLTGVEGEIIYFTPDEGHQKIAIHVADIEKANLLS